MRKNRFVLPSLFLLLISACLNQPDILTGSVRNKNGPVGGAVVRIQTSEISTITDKDGNFAFSGLSPKKPSKLTAWSSGYYIAGGEETYLPGETEIVLELKEHIDTDYQGYEWLSAFSTEGKQNNCQNCHSQEDDPLSHLPFDEWILDAHSQSTRNVRFLTMYQGTDIHGNQSPLTRKAYNRDYGSFPLPPDPSLPYYGPGYKIDFPDTAGNCSACHAPMQAISAPYGTDPSSVAEGAEGISCDFCHKIWAVNLNHDGLPSPNMPGVLSYQFRRPGGEHQLFMGPLDDVAPGEDTFSPLQNQSEFCAPCHTAVFWDTPIYNSFGEWLESPYSDPVSGKTCQECHMPTGLTDHFALIAEGGLERAPGTIFSHHMPGAASLDLLTNAVSVSVKGWKEEGLANVQVEITNDQTGHHVPTDSPLRHMILVIKARTESSEMLELIEGPVIPDWAGIGDPDDGHYGGQPGIIYAKVLTELWTEVSPSGNYWNPTMIASDNRIAAFETDTANFQFIDPNEGKLTINVELIFRRAFIELMDQKGWDVPDVMMAEEIIILE